MTTNDCGVPPGPRAGDLLTGDLGTLPDTASVSDAKALMRHLAVRHVPVLGAGGLIGMLYEPALADAHGSVLEHVIRDVPRVRLNEDIGRIAALLASSACGAVVVLGDAEHLVGVVTAEDLCHSTQRSA